MHCRNQSSICQGVRDGDGVNRPPPHRLKTTHSLVIETSGLGVDFGSILVIYTIDLRFFSEQCNAEKPRSGVSPRTPLGEL